MDIYLGVDGGGTKTKFLLCNERGEMLAESIQPTSHYLQCGYEGLQKVMEDGLAQCLTVAKQPREHLRAVFVACAGYGDIEKDCAFIDQRIHAVFKHIPTQIGNDTENALAGALAGGCGINVIAGTGSIALGKDDLGNTLRSGGWHHIFGGDEGSAYWIACELIRHFTRQADGREQKTLLYSYLKEKFSFRYDSDILDIFILQWKFDRTRIAGLAQIVFELAQKNDPIALYIFDKAAKELADITLALLRQLTFKNKTLISYTGGVFNSGSFILEPFKTYLSKEFDITLCPPILSPDAGSVILAMQLDSIELNDEIISQLRCRV